MALPTNISWLLGNGGHANALPTLPPPFAPIRPQEVAWDLTHNKYSFSAVSVIPINNSVIPANTVIPAQAGTYR